MARKKRHREYGTGSVFHVSRNGTYSIAWHHEGKRIYKHGFETDADARKELAIKLGDLAADRAQPKGSKSLAQLATAWLDARETTHASIYHDRNRWELHLAPTLGRMKPSSITPATVKDLIRQLHRKGLAPATCKLVVALLSSLFSDIIEDGHAQANPCKALSKATRALLQSKHDPKNTPYLHEMADVIRVYQGLTKKSPTVGIAFAIGALAGLRTGEIRALDWSSIDLKSGQVHVQVSVDGSLKDGESRIVPIQPSLAALLASWREIAGGVGLVCKPLRQGSRRFLDDHTMGKMLREVVGELGLVMACACCDTKAAWYEYTRHTYGCQIIMAGGTMEDLSRTMGHSTTAITEKHYVHLRPDYYRISARNLLTADFESDSVRSASKSARNAIRKGGARRAKAA